MGCRKARHRLATCYNRRPARHEDAALRAVVDKLLDVSEVQDEPRVLEIGDRVPTPALCGPIHLRLGRKQRAVPAPSSPLRFRDDDAVPVALADVAAIGPGEVDRAAPVFVLRHAHFSFLP